MTKKLLYVNRKPEYPHKYYRNCFKLNKTSNNEKEKKKTTE